MRFAKLLKWELIKRYYSLRYLLAGFAALLLLLLALPVPVGETPPAFVAVLFISIMLIIAGSFYIIAIYPSYTLVTGLRNQHAPLERSRAVPFALSTAAQFLANAVAILLTSGLVLAVTEIMKKFSNERTQYLTLTMDGSIWGYLIAVVAFFPAVILFSSVAGRSVRSVRSLAPVPTWLLSAVFMGFAFIYLPMVAAPWNDIFLCLISAAAFFGACWLYERKYEGTAYTGSPKSRMLKRILIIAMIIGVGALGNNNEGLTTGGGLGDLNGFAGIYPDVADWMNQCDAKSEGVYILEVSPEKAYEILAFKTTRFDDEKPWPERVKNNLYFICVYVNIQKGEDFRLYRDTDGKANMLSFKTVDEEYEYEIPEYILFYNYEYGRGIKKVESVTIDDVKVAYSLSKLE